jgi:virulence-associated protein VagC
MVLKARTRILQSRNSKTQYVTIPSAMVNDSQYPFKGDEEVDLEIVGKKLIIQPASKKT